MDTREYKSCDTTSYECREDDNSGCTFPNNVQHYKDKKTTINRVIKDSVCICTPQECSCSVEQTEIDN
ncbi:MAG: hypothetical protein E7019_04760 [Alphaproteobacteria bacterium]|nr:hypothetical protein [Alphaproteobacteria bacterium]